MSQTTTNYGFTKPELTDVPDITVLSQNWEMIDSILKSIDMRNKLTIVSEAADANSYATRGVYFLNNASNVPSEGKSGLLFVEPWSDSLATLQFWVERTTHEIYLRVKDYSWSAWSQISTHAYFEEFSTELQTTVQSTLSAFSGRIQDNYDYIDTVATALREQIGNTLVTDTIDSSLDHSKAYVYIGTSTADINKGDWIYYDGTTWKSGGVYNSEGYQTDKTLTVAGMAADAEVVGGEIDDLKSASYDVVADSYPLGLNSVKNSYIDAAGKETAYNNWTSSDYLPTNGARRLYFTTTKNSNYNAFYSDKTEESFIGSFAMATSNVNGYIYVPENAKYFRISNTSSDFDKTVIYGRTYSNNIILTNNDDELNNSLKIIGNMIYGEYVDNYTGAFDSSDSSNNYRRTDYINIANQNYLFFNSDVRTPFCAYYDENKNYVGTFIIQVGDTLLKKPTSAKYCAYSWSRYNGNITMYNGEYAWLKQIEITSIHDINTKYLGRTDALTQASVNRICVLVYTDIHGYGDSLNRIASFYNKNIPQHVNFPICLGDMVADQETDSIEFLNNEFGKKTLKVIGNHDVLVGGTLPGVTSKVAYDKYLADDISTWGVVQPSNASTDGLNYYYKDVTNGANTIRFIILDEYFYTQAQHEWFVSTLEDANTSGYYVVVCQHQSNVWNNQAQFLNDKKAFATPALGFDLYITSSGYSGEYANAAENRVMTVDSFIGNGGNFVCWMSGHTHSDQCHTFEKAHGKQLSLVFSNAGMSMTSSSRIANYSCDCFQYISFDITKKYIYVLRIGEALDKWFHKNELMCYDFENHTVVEYS